MVKQIKKQSFLEAALILTVAILIVKLIGALFKLPLANIIGENGMGYFNTAYNFYAVFFSLATAGFPVAIAKLVAESYTLGRYKDIIKIKQIALPIFFVTGLVASLIMFFGAKAYTNYIGNPGAYLSILILSPTIFFCSLSSVYRGYYEGLRNMKPTAVSSVIEALVKLLIGLSLAYVSLDYLQSEYEVRGTVFGEILSTQEATLYIYSISSACAILGVMVGSIISYIYLVFYYKVHKEGMDRRKIANSPPVSKGVTKKLLTIAVPIALASLSISVAGLVDQTFLLRRLTAVMSYFPDVILEMYSGFIPDENLADLSTVPNFLFGCYGYALTLFMLVPALTQGFAVSALSSLTNLWTKVKKDKTEIKKGMESVIRLSAVVAFPMGFGLTALAEPIITLLYSTTTASPLVAYILMILGVGAVFSALTAPIGSALQAIGQTNTQVIILVSGLIIKVVLNFYLCGIPQINIIGAPIATLCCYLFIAIFEFIALRIYSGTKINIFGTMIKPMICSVLCAVSAYVSYAYLCELLPSSNQACLISIGIAGLVYSFSILISRTLLRVDIEMLPNSEKFIKRLEKKGWIV